MSNHKPRNNVTATASRRSVLHFLFQELPDASVTGSYDAATQTWSHRDSVQFSPVKVNKEM